MLFPLAPQLAALRSQIPPALVSESAFEAIHNLTKTLPPIWGFAGLETRMTDDPQVDMLVCVSQQDKGFGRLRETMPGANWSTLDPIMPLFQQWTQPSSPLAQNIPFINLEFDFLRRAGEAKGADDSRGTIRPSDPMALFCIEKSFSNTGNGPSLTPAGLVKLSQQAVSSINGADVTAATWKCLERCAAALPEGARFLHLGIMHTRGKKDLRTLISIPRNQLHVYLEKIGWPGEEQTLGALLRLIGPHWPRISLQLDIGESVQEPIAIEHYLTRGPDKHNSWRRITDALISRGLATKERAEAALTWWGSQRVNDPELPWIMQLHRVTDLKITAKNAHDWSAKAYLGFFAQTSPF